VSFRRNSTPEAVAHTEMPLEQFAQPEASSEGSSRRTKMRLIKEVVLRFREIRQGLISDSGRVTGNPEVISSSVGLVPTNALARTVALLTTRRSLLIGPTWIVGSEEARR
jgi:hypothetical protein